MFLDNQRVSRNHVNEREIVPEMKRMEICIKVKKKNPLKADDTWQDNGVISFVHRMSQS